ncbi:MAG: CopD family protein [Alcaligenes nematophilus]|uniref:CopD family protein n=1 Tax=Alcaligenes nematophilus TaxID=2994643 RepID=UPI003D08A903
MTLLSFYPYLKAVHVTAVVFLVGGMLFHDQVVRALAKAPQQQQPASLALLLEVDRRVTSPALLLTWIAGLTLAISVGWLAAKWLLVKLVFVVVLSALHGVQSGRTRRFIAEGKPVKPLPYASVGIIITMLAVAVLAIVKPG